MTLYKFFIKGATEPEIEVVANSLAQAHIRLKALQVEGNPMLISIHDTWDSQPMEFWAKPTPWEYKELRKPNLYINAKIS